MYIDNIETESLSGHWPQFQNTVHEQLLIPKSGRCRFHSQAQRTYRQLA